MGTSISQKKAWAAQAAAFRKRVQIEPPNTPFNFEDRVLRLGLAHKAPKDIDIKSRFSTNVPLNKPAVSAAMDTVSGAEMGIALARIGMVAVMHRNSDVDDAVRMVKKVKRAEAFMVEEPVTVTKDMTVAQVEKIQSETGYSGLPVVEDGRLIGIVSQTNLQFQDPATTIEEIMTVNVVKALFGVKEPQAREMMKGKVKRLPVVDKEGILKGLITAADIKSREFHTEALRGKDGRLLAVASIGAEDWQRAVALEKAGVNAIVIDVASAYNSNVVNSVRTVLQKTAYVDIVLGNFANGEGAEYALRRLDIGRGIAGVKGGFGSGSICESSEKTSTGGPTLMATMEIKAKLLEMGLNIPLGADGGHKTGGHIALALAHGASYSMLGFIFAGTDETPGEPKIRGDGSRYKLYWGMGSKEALAKRHAKTRYPDPGGKGLEEGVKTKISSKGSVVSVVEELERELRASMGYAGASDVAGMLRTIPMKLQHKADKGIKKVDEDDE